MDRWKALNMAVKLSICCLIILFHKIQVAESVVPGKFFWKPRLGLYLSQEPKPKEPLHQPTRENIVNGLVVLIDGYSTGITLISLAAGYQAATKTFKHLSPMHAHFYTNVYRWGLRYLNLIPSWVAGKTGNYANTHKVWSRRYYFMDEFVPNWMRKLIPWVKKSEWKSEEDDFKTFKKYAEPSFGKHYKYPNKIFDDWKSQITKETVENLDS